MRELTIAYCVAFALFLLCTGLSTASVGLPNWFRSHVQVGGLAVDTSYGLNSKCSSYVTEVGAEEEANQQLVANRTSTQGCEPFPSRGDCNEHGEAFCAIWRSCGFAMWLALMLQAGICFAFVNTIYGNKFTFDRGWKVLSMLIAATVVLQGVSTIAMDVVLETAGLFEQGHWRIGRSWAFATASWVLSLLVATNLACVGYMSPDDGYDMFYDSDFETDNDDNSLFSDHDDFQKFTRQSRRDFVKARHGF